MSVSYYAFYSILKHETYFQSCYFPLYLKNSSRRPSVAEFILCIIVKLKVTMVYLIYINVSFLDTFLTENIKYTLV